MDFLKKHYEKILLGVVLIGLAVAVAFLPFVISGEQAKLKEMSDAVLTPRPKPLTNLDLTVPETALKRVATPAVIDFGAPNRLFNPMPWQKTADNKLILGAKAGPTALTVTNVAPLYLKLSLDRVETIADAPKYDIIIEKQAAATLAQRGKKQTYCKLNDKNDTFQLVEIKGKPEDPSQLIVVLNDTGEKAVISKDKPFQRIDGYKADLRYELEKKSWPDCRVNSKPLTFNGEEYNVVGINQNEVVLSAKSNGKKWTIKTNPNVTVP